MLRLLFMFLFLLLYWIMLWVTFYSFTDNREVFIYLLGDIHCFVERFWTFSVFIWDLPSNILAADDYFPTPTFTGTCFFLSIIFAFSGDRSLFRCLQGRKYFKRITFLLWLIKFKERKWSTNWGSGAVFFPTFKKLVTLPTPWAKGRIWPEYFQTLGFSNFPL